MHDAITKVTERGQTSLPASIRRELGIRPGHRLLWQTISRNECRVILQPTSRRLGVRAMRGFMKRFQQDARPRTTAQWMRFLRAGERA